MSEACPKCGADGIEGHRQYPICGEPFWRLYCPACGWYSPEHGETEAEVVLRRQLTQAQQREREAEQAAANALVEVDGLRRQLVQRDKTIADLRAGRKRWYACNAGVFEGILSHVQLDRDWIVPETDCHLSREAAEAAKAEPDETEH